jgi:hypothetical protein
MPSRHLFYVESETDPNPNNSIVVAHIASADGESQARAEQVLRASLMDECLPKGSYINSVRYLGTCDREVLVRIGELAQ